MSGMEDRVLALAGVLQALAQVRRIAETGQSETSSATVALDSVFRIDAATPLAVYGRVGDITPGLRVLRSHTSACGRMAISGRMADVCAELDRLAASENQH